ncbi:hypothetical protein E1B28_008552 [Marasmius oreades]|uniref:Uncharacterized protein n=1 Tax=Marasmius oreades TaxID=181124 RepID=A0A9P7RZ78_9AGAR|nr:uncharacterized protein E1B28_008552 [Marasmius oreades]KAG7092183.1 hypothetical protein E1B28_008552 [Marasmius oreades]
MPRRSPPTALRLASGPTPPRNTPKHTMPSVPRPAFYPQAAVPRGPSPTPRHKSKDWLVAEFGKGYQPIDVWATPAPKVRGPWDHAGSIRLPFNAESLLAPMKPVAVM